VHAAIKIRKGGFIMKRTAAYALTATIAGLLFTAATALAGSNVSLLASNFDRAGFDTTTATTAAPLMIYDNTVKVPASNNVLLISISADSGTTQGPLLNCQVDGANCASSAGATTAAPDGWISADDDGGDDLVNLNYTWCMPISRAGKGKSGLTHEVTLAMAVDNFASSNTEAGLEGIHVSIEAAKVKDKTNACTGAGFP
jgi:hypothetical protein